MALSTSMLLCSNLKNLARRNGRATAFFPTLFLAYRNYTRSRTSPRIINAAPQLQWLWLLSTRRNCSTTTSSAGALGTIEEESRHLRPRISPSSPLLMLPFEDVTDGPTSREEEEERDYDQYLLKTKTKTVNLRFFSLAKMKVVSLKKRKLPQSLWDAHQIGLSCGGGWFAYLDRAGCKFYLANPFPPPSTSTTSLQIVPLPPLETLPSVSHIVTKSSPDGSLSIEKIVKLHVSCRATTVRAERIMELADKVVMSSPPTSPGCIVAVLIKDISQVSFCRPEEDLSWSPLQSSFLPLADVTYSNRSKLFYTLASGGGSIEAWDLSQGDPAAQKKGLFDCIEYDDEHEEAHDLREIYINTFFFDHEYLVESPSPSPDGDGGFMMRIVRRYGYFLPDSGTFVKPPPIPRNEKDAAGRLLLPFRTVRFEVYKLDLEQRKGKRVDRLGDGVALFVGSSKQSFALSVAQFPELKPNSIYFSDDELFNDVNNDLKPLSMSIYNLKDHTITTICPCDSRKIHDESPFTWIFPSPSPSTSPSPSPA